MMTEIEAYTQQVQQLRQEFNAGLRTGEFSSSLAEKIDELKNDEQRLLTQALPHARRRVLDRRDPQAVISSLVKAKNEQAAIGFGGSSDLTKKELDEAGLSGEEMTLCKQLLSLNPPDEPWIPEERAQSRRSAEEEAGAASAAQTTENDSDAARENVFSEDQVAEKENHAAREFPATPCLSVNNDSTCFVFLDDGSVILYENNDGWQRRSIPILEDCFAENAIMESDHSCLLLNLDHGIDRLAYRRISTPDDLLHLPLFTG